MAEIKLVIKIDEEDYKIMRHNIAVNNPLCPLSQEEMVSKVAKGTPLPKEHGRLMVVSEDAVKREQCAMSFSCQNWISEVGLSNATMAIIEADKESEAE